MENKVGNADTKVIDFGIILKKIISNRKLYYKILPVTFVLACAYVLCIPRHYTSSLILAPEMGGASKSLGDLGSIASNFGFNLNDLQSSDAISPLLYPDLMDDNRFVAGLFSTKIESLDGKIKCSYYEYILKYQKVEWWNKAIVAIKDLFKKKENPVKRGNFDPYILSKTQDDIAGIIRDNIKISFDKKTAVISISVKAQDPLICKTLADSVKGRLQLFITDYRTNKARIDEEYYRRLALEAKRDYEKARQIYGSYSDENMDVMLESFKSKQADLENEMQLKYNTYSMLVAQYQSAKAKVQERTPAFTVVKGASVPIKPSGPKRMLIVVGILFLVFISVTIYVLRKNQTESHS